MKAFFTIFSLTALFFISNVTYAQKEQISYLPFELGDPRLNIESQMILEQMIKKVDITREVDVELLGIKDEAGTDFNSFGMVQRRSAAVMNYLKSKGLKVKSVNVVEAVEEYVTDSQNVTFVKASHLQLMVSIRKPASDEPYVSVLDKRNDDIQTANAAKSAVVSRPVPTREGTSQASN